MMEAHLTSQGSSNTLSNGYNTSEYALNLKFLIITQKINGNQGQSVMHLQFSMNMRLSTTYNGYKTSK